MSSTSKVFKAIEQPQLGVEQAKAEKAQLAATKAAKKAKAKMLAAKLKKKHGVRLAAR